MVYLDKYDERILDLLLNDAEPTRLVAEALDEGEERLREALDRMKRAGLLFSFDSAVTDRRGTWDDTWWGLTPAGFKAVEEVPSARYWIRLGLDPDQL
jgi:DNA-binding Lrp family transcriptional regulator